MAGLLDHSGKSKKKLTRGAEIKVANQVTRQELSDQDKIASDNNIEISMKKQVDFPVNIRVNNHVRNNITALLNLGLGNSASELVNRLVNEQIETLEPSQIKRFNQMVDILEQKDYLKRQK